MVDTDNGFRALDRLCEQYVIGIWGHSNKYPDKKIHTDRLFKKHPGVRFVNTDLPKDFL